MLAYNNTAATDGMTYAVVEEFSGAFATSLFLVDVTIAPVLPSDASSFVLFSFSEEPVSCYLQCFTCPFPFLCAFAAQLNTSTLVYLDPANINITLLNEAPPLPSDFNLIGGYGQYYLRQLATAHFLPDLMSATGYTFIALVDDGCNPPKYSNTVNLSSTACPSIVVKAGLFPGSPAPAFTDSGPGRVTFLGSTNLSALLVDADHFSGYSWAVTAPGGLTVTVEDAGTLQPSFVPPVAGGYSATLTISLSPLCSYNATVTVTVGCSISSPPPLVASIAQSEPIPLSAPSQLTIVSAGGGGTVYWLGAPNDGALNATWAPVPSVDYTYVPPVRY